MTENRFSSAGTDIRKSFGQFDQNPPVRRGSNLGKRHHQPQTLNDTQINLIILD
jgi:hypothetical protein